MKQKRDENGKFVKMYPSREEYESKIAKPIIRKEPYDNSEEAYHARVRALFKKIYGVDFPAKR